MRQTYDMPREAWLEMQEDRKDCVWCGSEMKTESETDNHKPHFCSECRTIYEVEGYRPLFTTEIRHPHND